ncbi:MAG: Protein kinase domain [Solimicrobium sp.]|jgi:hypothetical protein|nr:Protein kinase domain [Solimicrobium sp.]
MLPMLFSLSIAPYNNSWDDSEYLANTEIDFDIRNELIECLFVLGLDPVLEICQKKFNNLDEYFEVIRHLKSHGYEKDFNWLTNLGKRELSTIIRELKNHPERLQIKPEITNGSVTIAQIPTYFPENIIEQKAVSESHQYKYVQFQKNIRRFNVTGVPEPFGKGLMTGFVPALRDHQRKAIAYELPSGRDKNNRPLYRWIPFPPKICRPKEELKKGGFKVLTHGGDVSPYVGFTLITRQPSKKERVSCSFDPTLLGVFEKHNLKRIVPQIRVDESRMIAVNLGPNLHDLINQGYRLKKPDERSGDKQFLLSSFVELAENIDTLHSLDIVHRDIKLENMFLSNGHIHLSDLDSMGIVGKLAPFGGTTFYHHPVFRKKKNDAGKLKIMNDNADRNSVINAYKKDQHTFFFTLMLTRFSKKQEISDYLVRDFISNLPCSKDLQKELENFYIDPSRYTLSEPIASYLKSPMSWIKKIISS